MGSSIYPTGFGPNVEQIFAHGTRVVRGRVPAQVRRELMAAVKAGVLCRLPKDGLKPEIFYHPNCRNSAHEIQAREAKYSIDCIATVIAPRDHLADYLAAEQDRTRKADV